MNRLWIWCWSALCAVCLYVPAMAGSHPQLTLADPAINEEFHGWTGSTSPDGIWRRNGNWTATGNNLFLLTNCVMSETLGGQTGGYLRLTVNAGVLQGGEIQTYSGGTGIGFKCNMGYYEVRMKVTSVSGCCVSFFRIGNGYAGNPEIDLEFLTNESWNRPTSTTGQVHCMLHQSTGSSGGARSFPFNPTTGFHTYGFLWTAQQLQWLADGQVIQTTANVPCGGDGIIMMNAWTGNANWGGGPPTTEANSYYDYVKYWPNATSIPVNGIGGIPIQMVPGVPPVYFTPLFANPLNDVTQIKIDRTVAALYLYDVAGRPVAQLAVNHGRAEQLDNGRQLPAGLYLLRAEGCANTERVVLVR